MKSNDLIDALNYELDFHLLPEVIRKQAYAMEQERETLRRAMIVTASRIKRDRNEPDKILSHVQSMEEAGRFKVDWRKVKI